MKDLFDSLFNESGVLLGVDGQPLKISMETVGDQVGGLAEDWEDELECPMVLALLEDNVITRNDFKDMAFAMYNEPNGQAIERLVLRLIRTGRAKVEPGKRIVAVSGTDQTLADAEIVAEQASRGEGSR